MLPLLDAHCNRKIEVLPGTTESEAADRRTASLALAGEEQVAVHDDRRCRVLCLIKGLGPGGAERLLLSLVRLRHRSSFDYEVAYLLPWKTALVADVKQAGVPVTCLGVNHEEDIRWSVRLRRLLREGAYDIVHVHSPYAAGIARVVVRSLPERLRPAVVSTEHNVWHGYRGVTQLLTAATFHWGDAWLAVSDPVRQSMPSRLRRRIEVVVNGVIVDDVLAQRALRDEVRAELGIRPDEIAIVTVANLTGKKGYPDLMAAARLLLDRGVPARFISVGQGPLEEELHALHRSMDFGDRFLMLGYQREPTRILAGCDVFALASHHEGLPVALMEAMVIGLPAVVTNVGGVPDAVTHGVEGLLVGPGRPDLLAAALEQVVRDPSLRASLGAGAAERGPQFDMRKARDRIESIYRELSAAR